jgi:hypothetical protein
MKVVDGLYDPLTKTLYIANWIDTTDQEETLAHELDHALQDQYFDLQTYLENGVGDTMDEQFARSCVMEGEATAIALNYSLEDQNRDFTQLVNIADWVRFSNMFKEEGARAFGKKILLHDAISFPYVYGAGFLQKYVKVYGWQGMKYLFNHPPVSTHQIMHPGLFFPKRRNPVGVKINDLSPGTLPRCRKIWENTLGEYGWFLVLRGYLDESVARTAVSGWAGDQIQVYEDTESHRMILAAYLVFEGEGKAEDFFYGCRELLGRKYSLDSFLRSDDTIYWALLSPNDAEVYVERFGRRVVLIEGTVENETVKVRGALWDVVSEKTKKLREEKAPAQPPANGGS